jgi:transposase
MVVLLALSSGQPNRRIAQELKTSRLTVIPWRNRFAAGGPVALTEDQPGRGRRPRVSGDKVKQIIEATLHERRITKGESPRLRQRTVITCVGTVLPCLRPF